MIKGWYEAQKPVITKKGVERKAPRHREVTTRDKLKGTLRTPIGSLSSGVPLDRFLEDKVQFIDAMSDYMSAGKDLERRKRSFERVQKSKYYEKWFDEFFYEHNATKAREKLLEFFGANQQGLQFIDYSYYGLIGRYLTSVSR